MITRQVEICVNTCMSHLAAVHQLLQELLVLEPGSTLLLIQTQRRVHALHKAWLMSLPSSVICMHPKTDTDRAGSTSKKEVFA